MFIVFVPGVEGDDSGNRGSQAVVPADMCFEPEWREAGDCGRCALYTLLRLEGRAVSMSELKAALCVHPKLGSGLALC